MLVTLSQKCLFKSESGPQVVCREKKPCCAYNNNTLQVSQLTLTSAGEASIE